MKLIAKCYRRHQAGEPFLWTAVLTEAAMSQNEATDRIKQKMIDLFYMTPEVDNTNALRLTEQGIDLCLMADELVRVETQAETRADARYDTGLRYGFVSGILGGIISGLVVAYCTVHFLQK